MKLLRVAPCLALAFVLTQAVADPVEEADPATVLPGFTEIMEDQVEIRQERELPRWIEEPRLLVSRSVTSFGTLVDDFLTEDESCLENESYLRLRMGEVLEEGGESYPRNDLKLKIDLPKTENRWSLVLESDSDDFDSLEDQYQERPEETSTISQSDGTTGAIRFFMDDLLDWRADLKVGVKGPFPLNPFVRSTIEKRYPLGEVWLARVDHSLYYYHEEGLGERSRLVFQRKIGEQWSLSHTTDMQWQEQDAILEFGEILSLRHSPTNRDFLTYRVGAYYEEHPASHLTAYFMDMRYRRRLHSNWLFAELVPDVTWARSEKFNDIASLTLRLEVRFTD